MLTVSEIWRFPVKSLGGEQLDAADVDELGIAGDRQWGLYDPATGMVLTARREPDLLFLSSRLDGGRPVITDEHGAVLADDAALSARLGRPVELRAASDGPGTFENPMDVDNEADWMQWQSSGGTFHDGRSKISLVSRASLGEWDRRRFRINLILDGSGEETLAGDVTVGAARLSIRKPIDRCIMISRAQPGIDKDLSVLKRVIKERDNKLGIGAVVTSPGAIAVGDVVSGIDS
ncbi:MAG: MOSC N-terminal beta barrel domain-containing protein [Ilumatobacter sp.]|uniref:MOSC domain-containing protein n=1 Tax=Ilumatobacter sp. TaxID=1967498 RepID=UPI00261D2260|nr:MOSC N-terminal beta barrel domain-containing protein [Ilumatobacter sp.]MDJ0769941.1 MOSC N-terminal beta barrel domain-containing protein [Ilumatobacter sp.]